MSTTSATVGRRSLLRSGPAVGLGLAGWWMSGTASRAMPDAVTPQEDELIRRVLGAPASLSPRVHLDMPAVFSNGYSVPLTLSVDSPMTEADHVRTICVLAPQNPIVAVATFGFTPISGRAEISTRIRLARPQAVLAVATLGDGTRLMARHHVTVETDGCS